MVIPVKNGKHFLKEVLLDQTKPHNLLLISKLKRSLTFSEDNSLAPDPTSMTQLVGLTPVNRGARGMAVFAVVVSVPLYKDDDVLEYSAVLLDDILNHKSEKFPGVVVENIAVSGIEGGESSTLINVETSILITM